MNAAQKLVLLDEHIPHNLRTRLLPKFDARTVAFQGWVSFRNGRLMNAAEAAGFDVIVTMDEGFRHQRPATVKRLAVVLVRAKSNAIEDLEPLIPQLITAIDNVPPGSVAEVGPTST